MSFSGLNYLAILVSAVVGWVAGAIWYTVLSRHWMAAQGKTPEEFRRQAETTKGTPAFYLPFVLAFVAQLVMAWVLAGLLAHLGPGQVTVRNGVISGAFVWLGFVATTVAVNNMFAMRRFTLTIIDAGHWLVVLVLIGAVIGAFGV